MRAHAPAPMSYRAVWASWSLMPHRTGISPSSQFHACPGPSWRVASPVTYTQPPAAAAAISYCAGSGSGGRGSCRIPQLS